MSTSKRYVKLTQYEKDALMKLLEDSDDFVKREQLPGLIARVLSDLLQSVGRITR
jgi:DNA-binding winged helix-turn-helix (wHTH) protein